MPTMPSDTVGRFFTAAIPCTATVLAMIAIRDSRINGMPLLAIALTVWFAAAFFISMQDAFFVSPTNWSKEDYQGFIMFSALPIVPMWNFLLLYQIIPPLREHLLHFTPPWRLIGLQTYRISGSCFLYMYFNGAMPNYYAFQTGVLNVLLGATAIPLSHMVKRHGIKSTRKLVLLWNTIGLYDLTSVFVLIVANFVGYYELAPGLSIMGFYPLSLIPLFQGPIAMITHLIFLTNIDVMGFKDD